MRSIPRATIRRFCRVKPIRTPITFLFLMEYTSAMHTVKIFYSVITASHGERSEEASTCISTRDLRHLKSPRHTKKAPRASPLCSNISPLVSINADGVMPIGRNCKRWSTTTRNLRFRWRLYGTRVFHSFQADDANYDRSDIDYLNEYRNFENDPNTYPYDIGEEFLSRLHADGQHYIPIVDSATYIPNPANKSDA